MTYGLAQTKIIAIQNVFAAHPEITEAVLYGSRAKGTYREGSDIDLVLKGENLNLTLLNKISWELDDLFIPERIYLLAFKDIDNAELIEHIERVGAVLYRKGN